MGTSADYAIAVEEGATLVRIGQAILGPDPHAEIKCFFLILAQLIDLLSQILILLVFVSVILSYFMPPYHPVRAGSTGFLSRCWRPSGVWFLWWACSISAR